MLCRWRKDHGGNSSSEEESEEEKSGSGSEESDSDEDVSIIIKIICSFYNIIMVKINFHIKYV